MNVFIDLETIPDQSEGAIERIAETIKPPAQMKKPETINDWMNGDGKYAGERDAATQEKYLKTSFDADYGQICCACIDFGGVVSTVFTGTENQILTDVWEILNNVPTLYFIAHNAKFDLPFLWKRSIINNIKPSPQLRPHGRHGSHHYCTMEGWAGYGKMIGMDRLAKLLGLESKTVGMDGSQVWHEFQQGNIDKIAEYCEQDVKVLKSIYQRLTGDL